MGDKLNLVRRKLRGHVAGGARGLIELQQILGLLECEVSVINSQVGDNAWAFEGVLAQQAHHDGFGSIGDSSEAIEFVDHVVHAIDV